jgi:hypothetical protein
MSGWIKFWKDMQNDPRVVTAAAKLSERYILARRSNGGGVDLSLTESCNAWRNAVTGALVTLWCYADEHIRDDDSLPLTSQTLDAVVGLEGFFDVMPREWINKLDNGDIVLPGYCEKNSLIAKRKRTIKSNARVTRWRREKKHPRNGVTSRHVTQHTFAGDQDQDQDQDHYKRERASKRCPTDFVVTEVMRLEMATECPGIDLDQETRKLRDHTFKAARSDWPATWRNWMRNAKPAPSKSKTRFDQAMEALPHAHEVTEF